jgi:hypothetical protein
VLLLKLWAPVRKVRLDSVPFALLLHTKLLRTTD